MRRKEGWGKTLFALLAVAAALAGTFSPPPKRSTPQRSRQLLPPASAVLAGVTIDPLRGTYSVGFANAFLVDAARGLYATSAHVVENIDVAMVVMPGDGESYHVRFPSHWRHDLADLAIVQVEGPHALAGTVAYRIASGPPRQGEMLTIFSYQTRARFMGATIVEAKRKSFRVERPAGDGCVNSDTCQSRDRVVEDLLFGKPVNMNGRRFLYPRYIYVVRPGPDQHRGIIPGMSGSAVFDGSGAVVGVTAAYYQFDPSGGHGRLSPAYLLGELLASVRAEVDAQKK